jgi:hypothetical protein
VRHRRFNLCLAAAFWLAAIALALVAPVSLAQDNPAPAKVYLFWVAGCPHCEREIDFLQRLVKQQPQVEVKYFEISGNAANRKLYHQAVQTYGIADPAVPLTVIGNQIWVGYSTDTQSGAEMRSRIVACLASECPDALAGLTVRKAPSSDAAQAIRSPIPEKLNLPLLGEISTRDLSLPVLTIILGALDGFNPCAMWTLIFLIGLLVGMKDSVRMWTLGSAFIIGSAAVYFLFMAAWLNLLLFLGSLLIVRIVIGLVALGGGAYYLREFILNKDAVCEVTAPEQRQRVFHRLKSLAQERSFLIALFGILALAFLVNLVELICSAGIPAVYIQILAMHALPKWQYYGYLLLYILVFMADDLLVFLAAMLTLRVSGIATNYARYSHLIGGVVLVIIGALMLLRPELLMFG